MSVRWSGVIAVEGEVSVDGRLLRVDALTWSADALPLTRGGLQVGSIERVLRINGELHAEGLSGVALQVGQPLAAMLDEVAVSSSGDVAEFTYGRLRSVELTARSAWDQCRVTRVAL